MPSTAEHPMRLKKLNRDRRLMLAKLAAERFRCTDLRAVEEAAHARLSAILERDANRVSAKEIAVLEKHGFAREIRGFRLPSDLTFRETGERTFKRPDGVEVKREGGETRSVKRPEKDEYELPRFASWDQALKTSVNRPGPGGNDYRAEASQVKLKKAIRLPGSGSVGDDGTVYIIDAQRHNNRAQGSRLDCQCINGSFLSDDVLPAMVAFYVAADARICEERRLIVAAVKVIASCDLYGQVLDFWPEAAEIEEKLFEGVLPNAFSLVALSDDDKAALCRNMASRGVESPICHREVR